MSPVQSPTAFATAMDRQRFLVRRNNVLLGLACDGLITQFRRSLAHTLQGLVNTLQKQGEREMKPPAESLFDNLATRVRKQDYISTGNLACEYKSCSSRALSLISCFVSDINVSALSIYSCVMLRYCPRLKKTNNRGICVHSPVKCMVYRFDGHFESFLRRVTVSTCTNQRKGNRFSC